MTGPFPSTQVTKPVYRRLTPRDLDRIYDGVIAGRSMREIARDLDRPESAVRRAVKRQPLRSRLQKHGENQRNYARRQMREQGATDIEVREAVPHVRPSANATRRKSGGADGKLLGVFAVGGSGAWRYAGGWVPGDPRRHAEWLEEREAMERRTDADRAEGWGIDAFGERFAVVLREFPHGLDRYQASPKELPSLIRAGAVPAPEYKHVVTRYVAVEDAVDARMAETKAGMPPSDWENLLPEDIAAIRADLREEIRDEMFPLPREEEQ